jgi:hypothetical protein
MCDGWAKLARWLTLLFLVPRPLSAPLLLPPQPRTHVHKDTLAVAKALTLTLAVALHGADEETLDIRDNPLMPSNCLPCTTATSLELPYCATLVASPLPCPQLDMGGGGTTTLKPHQDAAPM